MGIHGLLPLMKSIMVPIHIKDLKGCIVAVDTYSWLHKGALSCSKDLCLDLPTSRHIDYCMHRVNLLRHYGVKPMLVFDGGLLPMKSDEEAKRSRARKENLERAIEHESAGNSAAAYDCYQKAVDISPSVARELIEVLKEENVDYIVAPYEADAQMAFLSLNNLVEAIITEDSDLIPFGCSRIIFKMDKFGQGVEFRFSTIQRNKDLNLTSFTKQMVLEMCILSGCDYLQSLPGMGLKRAHALVQKFKSYDKVIKHLRYSTISVPPLYEEGFKKALLTFQHQRVYDPRCEDIVHLTDIPYDLDSELDFLGPLMPQSVVNGIAKGDLDPFSKLPFQGKSISTTRVNNRVHSMKEFKIESKRKKPDSSAQSNTVTKYFCLASLEARRNLNIARAIPKHSRLRQEPAPNMRNLSSEPSCVDETAICTMNSSPGSPTRSQKLLDALPLKVHVEACITAREKNLSGFPCCVDQEARIIPKENLYHSEPTANLHQSSDDLAKPSMSISWNHESISATDPVDDRAGKRKLVRSRFFKSNILDKNDHDREKTKSDVEEEGGGIAPCSNIIPTHALLEQHKDEHVCQSAKRAREKQDQNLTSRNNNADSSIKEKKFSSSQHIQSGTSKMNRAPTNSIRYSGSDDIPDNDGSPMEMDDKEVKFGCDISHLSRYSDISEESMERFVSVISSFRYTGSGSRASGLRAPLKDVRNTRAVRSPTVPVDLSKYAYVPNTRKIASAGSKK